MVTNSEISDQGSLSVRQKSNDTWRINDIAW